MTVSPQIPSDRDLELLSAYLDGALTDREKEKLEQRLARETALRAVLDDLRETVALVRELPRLKAPRNFTLDPAIYARSVPWWKRLFALETALQLSGALGAAASIVLIVLAILLSQGAAEHTSMSTQPEQPAPIAMQATLTAPNIIPTGETPIAYAGEGLLQTTMAAQNTYYATNQPAPSLLPTQTAAGFAGAAGETAQEETSAATENSFAMEAGAVAPEPEEAPAAALGSEGPSMMEADSYPPAEPQDTVGAAAAPPPPTATPAPSVTASGEMPAAPQMAAPAESGFRDNEADETQGGSGETQPDSVANTATEEAPLATVSPVPVAQALGATSEKHATSEEKEESSQPRWWLAGIGLVTLVFSITLFVFGRRKARA